MSSRSFVIPGLLTAAVAVPYVATNAPQWIDAQGKAASISGMFDFASSSDVAGPDSSVPMPQGPGSELFPTTTPLEGMPTHSLAEVLRMDVSKEWVYGRWSRKSTSLADLNLFGVRVPLVTGTQLYDLAGSLSYYFGPDNRVHRLTFRGRTGDTTQVLAIAAARFGLTPEPPESPGEQLFRARRNGQVISEFRSRPAAVLWQSSPYDSYTVELVVQRPDTGVPLSQIPSLHPAPPNQAASPAADAATAANSNAADDAGAEAQKSAAADSTPAWNSMFPRSRVPPGQVNNLDRQNNMW